LAGTGNSLVCIIIASSFTCQEKGQKSWCCECYYNFEVFVFVHIDYLKVTYVYVFAQHVTISDIEYRTKKEQ